MHRFFFPEANLSVGAEIELPTEILRHLRTVLRLQVGDEVQLFDGVGGVAQAKLLRIDSDGGSVDIVRSSQVCPASLHLCLIQGLPKGDKLDLVLQKGTELGVNRFVLTEMTRSVSRLKVERKTSRLTRWQKIVQEAARQSGQPFLPQVEVVSGCRGALKLDDADFKLLLWEEAGQSLEKLLPIEMPRRITIIVGPEGGITADEAELAMGAGYLPVRIGPRILRTETAGLAIVSILQYLYGDLARIQYNSDAISQGKDQA